MQRFTLLVSSLDSNVLTSSIFHLFVFSPLHRLSDSESSIQLLQSKLLAKNDKYSKKKALVSTLQSKLAALEATLKREGAAGGVANSATFDSKTNSLPTDSKAVMELYKKSDDENRQINAALRAELEAYKQKYKTLAATSKELIKMQQANQFIQQISPNNANHSTNVTTNGDTDSTNPSFGDSSISRTKVSTPIVRSHVSLPNSNRDTPIASRPTSGMKE